MACFDRGGSFLCKSVTRDKGPSDGGSGLGRLRRRGNPPGPAAGNVVQAGKLCGNVERLRIYSVYLGDHGDGPCDWSGKGRPLQGVRATGFRGVLEGCRVEARGLGVEDGAGKVCVPGTIEFNGQEPGLLGNAHFWS